MKLQLLITADSPAELIRIAELLEAKTGVAGSTCTPQATIPTPAPSVAPAVVANPFAPAAPATPAIEPTAAQVFAPSPNVEVVAAATVAPLVPTQPVVTAASSTPAGVELDPRGFPWDERIHSSSRAKLAKGGFWKQARNVDPALVATVEAELRAMGYGRSGEPQLIVTASPATVASSGLPPALGALPSPPVVTGPTAQSLTERFTKLLADPLKPDIDDAGPGAKSRWIKQVITHYGVENLPALADCTPDTLIAIDTYLTSVGL